MQIILRRFYRSCLYKQISLAAVYRVALCIYNNCSVCSGTTAERHPNVISRPYNVEVYLESRISKSSISSILAMTRRWFFVWEYETLGHTHWPYPWPYRTAPHRTTPHHTTPHHSQSDIRPSASASASARPPVGPIQTIESGCTYRDALIICQKWRGSGDDFWIR